MAKPMLINGLGSPQSIYRVSTTQYHPIGTRGVLDDGRVYYYGRYTASTVLAAGKLCCSAVLTTQHEDLDCATAAFTAGSKKMSSITIGSTALTQDQYQYVAVVDSTATGGATTPGPEGLMFRISGHGAYSASATNVELDLYDEIPISSDAGTQLSLIKSPYADFVIKPTADLNDVVAGAPQCQVPAGNTTTQYVWLQTYGLGTAYVNGTPAEGIGLIPGATTAGHLDPATQTFDATMGTAVLTIPVVAYQAGVDGTDDEVQVVFWNIRG